MIEIFILSCTESLRTEYSRAIRQHQLDDIQETTAISKILIN